MTRLVIVIPASLLTNMAVGGIPGADVTFRVVVVVVVVVVFRCI